MTSPVTAFAPGGVGNVGPGLDIVGLAVAGAGDEVSAEWSDRPGFTVIDAGHPSLPTDPRRHAAALAGQAVVSAAGANIGGVRGIALRVRKGLPLCGGQGGSAASSVAGAVAVNALLGHPLARDALLEACLVAEEAVAGRHLDNIAPALLGGIVLIRSMDPIDVIQLPVPDDLVVVLVRPDQEMRTSEARSVLPREIARDVALHQAAQVAAMVAALSSGDYALLGRSVDDRIAEPARARLLPGFAEAKAAALGAGAYGSSISGSGPTTFALARGERHGERIAKAMVEAYASRGQRSEARIGKVDRQGARVLAPGEAR